MIRVWTLGMGIGFGRYPLSRRRMGGRPFGGDAGSQGAASAGAAGEGIWKASWGIGRCGCASWIMEPEEVFAEAKAGDARCVEFVNLGIARWPRPPHSIHLEGPGKFFITGLNARFLNLTLVNEYLHEMVKLSPLQGYSGEIVPGGGSVAAIGAAVNASQAAESARGFAAQ